MKTWFSALCRSASEPAECELNSLVVHPSPIFTPQVTKQVGSALSSVVNALEAANGCRCSSFIDRVCFSQTERSLMCPIPGIVSHGRIQGCGPGSRESRRSV